jgi:hypothetical protein
VKTLLAIISLSFAVALPYEFIHCKQQIIKEGTFLLWDKKGKDYHVICDPEKHYNKIYRHIDSIMVIENDYDIFIHGKAYSHNKVGWFRIQGKPGRPGHPGTERNYYGEWTDGHFKRAILPKIKNDHPTAKVYTIKDYWKILKKKNKEK